MAVRLTLGRVGVAVLVGLGWAYASIWLAIGVAPRYLGYAEHVAAGAPYALVSWTLLAPWTVARHLVADTPASLVLCPAIAIVACMATAWGLTQERWRTVVVLATLATLATGVTSSVCVAVQLRDAVRAEDEFFALVSSTAVPHRDAAVVKGAREFVEHHPDSRWRTEALRIVAMAEWDAGRIPEASAVWSRFEEGFRDPLAPGIAYAEYSRALCDERLGRRAQEANHLRRAVGIIRARQDGIQGWIARDAAARLGRLERSEGLVALGDYWKTKATTFANVYSIQ